jgi:hypothetical protein
VVIIETFSTFYTGIFCQRFFSSPNQKCTGDEVTFTCLVTDNSTGAIGSTLWNVTTPAGDSSFCSVRHNLLLTVTCGPDNEFTSMLTEQNGDNYTTTLSVPVDFNETTVECLDTVTRRVGSEDICIVGKSNTMACLSSHKIIMLMHEMKITISF